MIKSDFHFFFVRAGSHSWYYNSFVTNPSSHCHVTLLCRPKQCAFRSNSTTQYQWSGFGENCSRLFACQQRSDIRCASRISPGQFIEGCILDQNISFLAGDNCDFWNSAGMYKLYALFLDVSLKFYWIQDTLAAKLDIAKKYFGIEQ